MWQPIETAPEEAPILVFGLLDDDEGTCPPAVYYTEQCGKDGHFSFCCCYVTGDPAFGKATHWMPLPDPPTA